MGIPVVLRTEPPVFGKSSDAHRPVALVIIFIVIDLLDFKVGVV